MEMKNFQFKVDQVVYLTLGINKSRYDKSEYVEGIVTKVGRKYVTVKVSFREYQFDLTDKLRQKTDYAQDYYLYESLDILKDEKEKEKLANDFNLYFSSAYSIKNKLSLDQMRKVKEIISE